MLRECDYSQALLEQVNQASKLEPIKPAQPVIR